MTRAHGVRNVFLAGLLWALSGCSGSTQGPQTGNITLCGDKVSEISVDGMRYHINDARSCQGCQELQDTLKGYDCVSVRAVASGTYHRNGSFGKVGVYEGQLDLTSLEILEWRSKKKHF
ncbi:MAG: hypothetical protein RL318_2011 [Fibrobacterota bacterium]|jgi:hypothetical protein